MTIWVLLYAVVVVRRLALALLFVQADFQDCLVLLLLLLLLLLLFISLLLSCSSIVNYAHKKGSEAKRSFSQSVCLSCYSCYEQKGYFLLKMAPVCLPSRKARHYPFFRSPVCLNYCVRLELCA